MASKNYVFEKSNGDVFKYGNSDRFYVEETPHHGYWIWEGDSFERTAVERCDTLLEVQQYLFDKLN